MASATVNTSSAVRDKEVRFGAGAGGSSPRVGGSPRVGAGYESLLHEPPPPDRQAGALQGLGRRCRHAALAGGGATVADFGVLCGMHAEVAALLAPS